MSSAGERILRSVRQARAFARGETTAGFVVHTPECVDVKAIRKKLGLSQGAFAQRFGLSAAAIREWEQRRRQPESAARVLLRVIAHNPDAVVKALQKTASHRGTLLGIDSGMRYPRGGAARRGAGPGDVDGGGEVG